MISGFHRNLIIDTIEEINRLTLLPHIAATFRRAAEKYGFTSLGINGLPPPAQQADPVILSESTPEGFRDNYIEERFYLADHICAHARKVYEPFRYSEAPYDRIRTQRHERFLQALGTFGMGKGLIVPLGRPANRPACVWLAGRNPELDEDAQRAIQLIALFAASKAHAIYYPRRAAALTSALTQREREVLQWISSGKTSWEIGAILGVSERSINNVIADAMVKVDAVTRAQAVVNAIRMGEIEL